MNLIVFEKKIVQNEKTKEVNNKHIFSKPTILNWTGTATHSYKFRRKQMQFHKIKTKYACIYANQKLNFTNFLKIITSSERFPIVRLFVSRYRFILLGIEKDIGLHKCIQNHSPAIYMNTNI